VKSVHQYKRVAVGRGGVGRDLPSDILRCCRRRAAGTDVQELPGSGLPGQAPDGTAQESRDGLAAGTISRTSAST